MSKTKLECIIENAETYQSLSPLDCGVMIADERGTIVQFVQPKTFNMAVTVGSQAASSGAVGECVRTKREVHKTLPKDLYGVPVKAISIPVFDQGDFVGVIATAISLATQETLQNAAQTIMATSQEFSATIQELAGTATLLSNNLVDLTKNGEKILSDVKETDGILRFVSDVAANSNLLGLNAAIEAARAGEQGRGFAVVAEEIRKMATNSGQAVKDINKIILSIQKDINSMVKILSDTSGVGERQAAATEEMSAAMEQFVTSAENINKIAEII
ncbi:methyl-accepting chemotaxis protein [Heliophilum fasciatum]|uniref:Methyl-accepting chemotaxis protein (MCP) signaling protein n=1 Tax=Heliophilum fasciatum TaxID=35700 RepID=A0A4R2RD27_9FIRM|nr:methyl-accepting chemotaxis protein [Heliophilum fasciatum]MCW2279380.1 hypothetical protein [Heliophilum fasciatum]TCP60188.1 methyl-accepting chemotaxis protein (MCP) signaling protein [Heliophilum fasciatum]